MNSVSNIFKKHENRLPPCPVRPNPAKVRGNRLVRSMPSPRTPPDLPNSIQNNEKTCFCEKDDFPFCLKFFSFFDAAHNRPHFLSASGLHGTSMENPWKTDALDACLMVHGSWLKAHGSWPREARGGSWLMARCRPGPGDPEAPDPPGSSPGAPSGTRARPAPRQGQVPSFERSPGTILEVFCDEVSFQEIPKS